mgnify:FL=1
MLEYVYQAIKPMFIRGYKMNKYDAAKVLNLSGVTTKELVKKRFLELCKKYHPDVNPAGLEIMKLINAAYDVLKDHEGDTPFKSEVNYGEAVSDAISKIFGLAGLIIEVCGAWVWITGNTISHRAILKQSGFKYAPKKQAWYFRPDDYKSFSRGKYNLDEIRTVYGTNKPHMQKNQLAA